MYQIVTKDNVLNAETVIKGEDKIWYVVGTADGPWSVDGSDIVAIFKITRVDVTEAYFD